MKLLKIEANAAHFYVDGQTFQLIDKIGKDDLLRLANLVLSEEHIEIDSFTEAALPNQAHQVIYKSVSMKLIGLRDRRAEFLDESARLFLEDYENYKKESAKLKQDSSTT